MDRVDGRCLTEFIFGVLRKLPIPDPKICPGTAGQEQTETTPTKCLTWGFSGRGEDRSKREGAGSQHDAARDLDWNPPCPVKRAKIWSYSM